MTKYVNNNGVSEIWLNIKNYISAQLLGYSQTGHIHSASDITSGLSTVATSGSYNDLSNKPTIPSKTSDLTNDSGFITSDNTKIPLAGSNQISGSLVPSTDGTVNLGSSTNNYNVVYTRNINHGLSSGSLILSGGNGASNGSNLVLYGIDRTDGFQGIWQLTARGTNSYYLRGNADGSITTSATLIRPTTDGGATLGTGSLRFGQIYSTNSAISTSDERQKDNIKQIDDKLLQAWGNVNIVQFNFKDALEKKGENARLHTGYIAQNIQQACEENGVNPNDYGLFCHDSWEEQEEKKDENGQVIEPYRAKGDLYSLRYEEALVVECAYLRKQIELLQERLNKLEEK